LINLNEDLENKLRQAEQELDLYNPIQMSNMNNHHDENDDDNYDDQEPDQQDNYSSDQTYSPAGDTPTDREENSLRPSKKRARLQQLYTQAASSASFPFTNNQNSNDHKSVQVAAVANGRPVRRDLPRLSADTQLDTVQVANTVKSLLVDTGVGQRLFARQILGVAQSVLSDMFLKPKPWTECTSYKKRLYQRMHEWSQSKEEMEQLADLSSSMGRSDRRSFHFTNGLNRHQLGQSTMQPVNTGNSNTRTLDASQTVQQNSQPQPKK
jgi:hypothetical protein